ncbi:Phytase family (modular protein) [Candidatus Terasakiella magnetica]|nr:Phytase family (modular protein) [Candidatus Terasakiella magnetica]
MPESEKSVPAMMPPAHVFGHALQIRLDHLAHQLVEIGLVAPAQLFPSLGGVAQQQVHFGRAEITGIDLDQDPAGGGAKAAFFRILAAPAQGDTDLGEGQFDEFAHAVGFAGGEDEIIGLVVLQDAPHAIDVIAGMAPIALGFEVADVKSVLEPEMDGGDGAGDLAGDEGLAAGRPFVVEQDAVGGVNAIGLAVIDRDPIGVKLGGGVGAAGIERRGLALRNFPRRTVKLGGRSLIEPGGLFHLQDADGLKQAQSAKCVGIGGVFRGVETDLDVALGREVVDLGRLGFLHQSDKIGGVSHVAVMHEEGDTAFMGVVIEVIDPLSIERRRAPLYTMNGVAFLQQEFGKKRAILARDAGNQSCLRSRHNSLPFANRSAKQARLPCQRPSASLRSPHHESSISAIASFRIRCCPAVWNIVHPAGADHIRLRL